MTGRVLRVPLVVILAVVSGPIWAKVAVVELARLVRYSDLIVLAEDAAISQVGGVRVATARVERLFKGELNAVEISYVADPEWECDTAEARVGERTLLFLVSPAPVRDGYEGRERLPRRHEGRSVLSIAWAGRGRMPVRKLGDREYATVWTGEVVLPEDLELKPGPDAFMQSVELAGLLDAVESLVLAPP